jgi:hypothetical protein
MFFYLKTSLIETIVCLVILLSIAYKKRKNMIMLDYQLQT